jgi:hypothetical protein
VILGTGAVLLFVLAGRQWLFYDDWAFIVDRPGLLLAPHVGHWSTVPYLLFVAIRDIFGVDGYRPFALPVIGAQILASHLTWVIMRRVGVSPWLATAFTLVTVYFGVGGENVLWAFQVGFVGAVAAMLAVIVLLLAEKLGTGRMIAIAALTLVAVASSGTALPLLVVAVLVAWTRHGWRRTVIAFALPVLAYAAWYLAIGRHAPSAGRAHGSEYLGIPGYAITMLNGGFAGLVPIAALGSVTFAALAIWWLFGFARADRASRPAFLLFLAAPIFALFTAFSRIDLGIQTATAGRYLYLAVLVMLPFAALGLTRLIGRMQGGMLPAVALVVVVGVFGGLSLGQQLRAKELIAQNTRQAFSAAADLLREHPHAFDDGRQVYSTWAPDVTAGDLKEFVSKGWFRPTGYREAVHWSELLALSARVLPSSGPAIGAGGFCQDVAGGGQVDLGNAAGVEVLATSSTTVRLSAGGGDPSTLTVHKGWNRLSFLVTSDTPALEVSAVDPVQACAVP